MSRIFEALQRSESEKSGGALPLESVLATELLESVERDSPEPILNVAPAPAPVVPPELGHFQSVPVAIAPESRRNFLVRQGKPGGGEISLPGCAPAPIAASPSV